MISFFTSILGMIEPLKKEDLFSRNEFLIFLYYEREDFRCPLCQVVGKYLEKIQYPIKTINYYENPLLGSRFMTFLFPSIYLKRGHSFYKLRTKNIEDIERIAVSFDMACLRKIHPWGDPRSKVVVISSYLFHIFCYFLRFSEYVAKVMPIWLFSFIFGGICFLLFLSLRRLITLNVKN
ncbi:hypothetical protein EQH57_0942 [Dictyocoela roeselum]|nr:hypothetical protein EQH57_0942 [Dictyocoela roeselum]